MTAAAAKVYPQLWGDSYSSAAGAAIQAANGDCGWGYSGDWKDPSGNGCTGQYASMSKARLLSRRPAGAPEASLIVRSRLRLPRASASLGQSASWAALDGHIGLVFHRYAYDDDTCDEACIVVEGIYWASVSYMGGLYTQQRAASIQNEWLLATPDASMAVEPPGN